MYCKLGTGRCDDLLLLGARELSKNGLSDRSRGLNRQRVHEHVRGRSHGGQLARGSRQLQEQKQEDAGPARDCSPNDVMIKSIPSLLGGVDRK